MLLAHLQSTDQVFFRFFVNTLFATSIHSYKDTRGLLSNGINEKINCSIVRAHDTDLLWCCYQLPILVFSLKVKTKA